MFSNPEKNIAQLRLQEGMRVADLGAGTGFYSRATSIKVGNTGHVYAVEVQKDMLKKLESDIKEWGITNIDCIWGDIEKIGGTKIADKSMDVVIISNVLSQTEDKLGLIDEAKRILKENGKILLVDLKYSLGSDDLITQHIVTESRASLLFNKRGFKEIDRILVSPNQYGIIFIQ